MVAAELALILEVQTDEYWQDITAPMLETVRRRLRALIKLIELKRRPIVYSDFEDQIGQGTAIELRASRSAPTWIGFGRKRDISEEETQTRSRC